MLQEFDNPRKIDDPVKRKTLELLGKGLVVGGVGFVAPEFLIACARLQETSMKFPVLPTATAPTSRPAEKRPTTPEETLYSNPQKVAKGYIEALFEGDFEKVFSLLDPITQHRIQNEPQLRNLYTLFITQGFPDCRGVPVKDVVIQQSTDQKMIASVLLNRPCKATDPYTLFANISARSSLPGISTKVPQPDNPVSTLGVFLTKVGNRWHPGP